MLDETTDRRGRRYVVQRVQFDHRGRRYLVVVDSASLSLRTKGRTGGDLETVATARLDASGQLCRFEWDTSVPLGARVPAGPLCAALQAALGGAS